MFKELAACFPPGVSNPNPIAAPWQYPSEVTWDTPDGYRDEYATFTGTQALGISQVVTLDIPTDTPGNCNFYWTGLSVFIFGGAGVPAVRIRDSEGFVMMNTRVAMANDAPFGRRDYATPIVPGHRMAPGAILSLDLREIGGAAVVSVCFYIQGFRRWAELGDYAALRGGVIGGQVVRRMTPIPKLEQGACPLIEHLACKLPGELEPRVYDVFGTFTIAASTTLQNQAILIGNRDAPFHLVSMGFRQVASIGVARLLARLYNSRGFGTADEMTAASCMMGGENALYPVMPSLVWPVNSSIIIDLQNGGAGAEGTFQLFLSGFKIFDRGKAPC